MLNFPLSKYKISGNSMSPTFLDGDCVLAWSWFLKLKIQDVVVAKNRDSLIIVKRIKSINNNKYFLIGDNLKESTDSRNYGFVKKKDILGKVVKKI